MFNTRARAWLLGLAATGTIAVSPLVPRAEDSRPAVAKTRKPLDAERVTLQARRHLAAMNAGMNHEAAREAAAVRDDSELQKASEVARRHLAAMNAGMNHEEARAAAAIHDAAQDQEGARRVKRFRDAMNDGASREDAARAADEE